MTETQPTASNEVRALLATLWRYRVLVLVVALVAGAVGGLLAARKPTRYAATAQISVDTTNRALFGSGAAVSDPSVIPTAVAILASGRLVDDTNRRLGGKVSWSLDGVSAVPESQLIQITTTARHAGDAANAANAYARSYIASRTDNLVQSATKRAAVIQTQIDDLNPQLQKLGQQVETEQAKVNEEQARFLAAGGKGAATAPNTTTLDALKRQYDGLAGTIQSFQQQQAQYRATAALKDGGVSLAVPAEAPGSAVPNHLLRDVLLAAALGLVLGCVGAVVLSALAIGAPRRRRGAAPAGSAAPALEHDTRLPSRVGSASV